MSRDHLRALDLNLLLHLDALLRERHVTRAARRVGLTRSAMSRSLARLREHFDDALLVRAGQRMLPTPRALELAPPLARALDTLDGLVRARPTFDPATARETFTVVAADYGEALLLPRLRERLAAEAPGIDVAFVPEGDVGDLLEQEADLWLGPRRPTGAAVVWRRLFHEDFVLLARRGHPALGRRPTLAEVVALPHVLVAPRGRPGSEVDELLEARGHRRRIALRVHSFQVVPPTVAASDLVALYPGSLARRAAREHPLRRIAPPLALPGFEVFLAWHERRRDDPAHAWFRDLIGAVARG